MNYISSPDGTSIKNVRIFLPTSCPWRDSTECVLSFSTNIMSLRDNTIN